LNGRCSSWQTKPSYRFPIYTSPRNSGSLIVNARDFGGNASSLIITKP
jgi:hypothetical protein